MSSQPRAALYLRQSYDPTNTGLAVERQESECRSLIESRGWHLVATYVDNDTSASGTKARPGYDTMLRDYQAGNFDAVVAWDLDRLYRQPKQLEALIDLAERSGLLLATVGGDADLATDNGRLFARIKAAVARSEVERKTERQRAAHRQRVAAGRRWWGHKPLGYTIKAEVIPEEAEAVRWAYNALLDGVSLGEIGRGWSRRGFNPEKAKEWSRITIRTTLLAARNIGKIESKGEIVGDAEWSAIVDEATYWAAAAILRQPSRRSSPGTSKRLLLTGIATCPCGLTLRSAYLPRSTGGVRGYRCRANHVAAEVEWLDDVVLAKAKAAYLGSDSADSVPRETSPVIEVAPLLAQERALAERLDALSDSYARGEVPLVVLNRVTTQIETEQAEIRERLAQAATTGNRPFGRPVGEVLSAFERHDEAELRKLLSENFEIVLERAGKGRRRTEDSVTVRLKA